MTDNERVLTFKDLKEKKGWPYSRQHTQRLWLSGKVPKPFKFGDAGLNLWRESDIDAYFAGRATRDKDKSA